VLLARGCSTFANTLSENPLDLPGAGLWFTAKISPAASTTGFHKTLGAGITVTAPASGIGLIQWAAEDTSVLPSPPVQLYFDLEVEVQGAVYTAAAGRLVVEPDVTVRP